MEITNHEGKIPTAEMMVPVSESLQALIPALEITAQTQEERLTTSLVSENTPSTEDCSWRDRSLVPYDVGSGTDTDDSDSDSDSTSSSSDSVSSSSSSSGSSSDSDSSNEDKPPNNTSELLIIEDTKPKATPAKKPVLRTHGELALEDLPPIEELRISVPKTDTLQIGTVHAIVDRLVIVQSFTNTPALDLDSVLLLEDGTALGQVFDVLGPVICPLYAVRFNSAADIDAKGIKQMDAVYCAPQHKELTTFVFVEQLRRIKGSDASWKNNNEPPEECVEYSDDEQEKQAKAKRKSEKGAHSSESQSSEGKTETKTAERVILSPAQPVRKRMCWRGRRGGGNPRVHQPQGDEQQGSRPVVHPPTFTSAGGLRPDVEAPHVWRPRFDHCFGPPRVRPPSSSWQRPRNPFYLREEPFQPRFGETRPQFCPPPFNHAFANGCRPPPPPQPPPPPAYFSPHFAQFPPPRPPPPRMYSSSNNFDAFPPPPLPARFFSPPPPPPPPAPPSHPLHF